MGAATVLGGLASTVFCFFAACALLENASAKDRLPPHKKIQVTKLYLMYRNVKCIHTPSDPSAGIASTAVAPAKGRFLPHEKISQMTFYFLFKKCMRTPADGIATAENTAGAAAGRPGNSNAEEPTKKPDHDFRKSNNQPG